MNKVLFWVALLCVVMGATTFVIAWKRLHPLDSQPGGVAVVDTSYRREPADASQPWLKKYTLTERSGHEFHSHDLAGKVHVVSFFYSTCPGICLRMNTKKAEIVREFAPLGVKFVSISCDPEVDTPAVLREYASKLNAKESEWLFLTGGMTYLQRVGAEIYTVSLDKQTHVERFLVFDKWGQPRGQFNWNKPVESTEMKLLLTKLLAETEPPPAPPLSPRQKPEEEDADAPDSAPSEKPAASTAAE